MYIFILDLTSHFNGLGKDNCRTIWVTFKFWDLVCLYSGLGWVLNIWVWVLENQYSTSTPVQCFQYIHVYHFGQDVYRSGTHPSPAYIRGLTVVVITQEASAQSLATCFPICLCAWVRPAPCAARATSYGRSQIGEAKTQTHTHKRCKWLWTSGLKGLISGLNIGHW